MPTLLLIVHALIGTALLGAITHQAVAMLRGRRQPKRTFPDRYASVDQRVFTKAIACLYLSEVTLGAVIYPNYRLNVRIPFEEMSLGWAVGLFELKEHFAGIGLMALPLYVSSWRREGLRPEVRNRVALTILLAFIVWWSLLIGHVLNNIRGFG